MRGAHPVALLQLCDAVPVVQLLGLILASAHVEAVPSCGGPGDRSRWDWKARKSEGNSRGSPPGPGILLTFVSTTSVPLSHGLEAWSLRVLLCSGLQIAGQGL